MWNNFWLHYVAQTEYSSAQSELTANTTYYLRILMYDAVDFLSNVWPIILFKKIM